MRKSRFTETQIIGMIKEQGSSIKRLIQWINRSAERADCGRGLPQARHQPRKFLQAEGQIWRMDVSDARRLKQLEDENAKLKRLVADTMLDVVVLKDLLWSEAPSAIGSSERAER